MHQVFGKYPGKDIHRIGVAIGGILITSTLISHFWPLSNRMDLELEKQLKEGAKNSISEKGKDKFK